MRKAERRRQKPESRWSAVEFICVLAIVAQSSSASADGGTLRLSQRCGECQVSVFTFPSAPSVGPIDVSVLVQDAATGKIRDDLPVMVRLQSIEPPGLALEQTATAGAATNKLFRAAVVDVPDPGRWHAEILIAAQSPMATAADRKSPTLAFDFEVAEPAAHWLSLAPWVGGPIGMIALFLVHQCLVASSARKSTHSGGKSPIAKIALTQSEPTETIGF